MVALATAAAVTAVGALLVTALFVIPAATTRLWTSRMRTWQVATIALCAAEGMAGVLLSVELNAPPGAAIALLAGIAFALSAVVATVRRGAGGAGGPLARWVAAGAAVFLISGCGSDSGDEGVSVVATTPVVGDLAQNVAGEDVEVTTLMSADTDPHDYEPRPDDVEALASADLVISSGGDVDAWIDDAVGDSGSGAEVLVLGDVVPHELPDDPHWWHDPLNAAAGAGQIAGALADISPEARASIEARADAYIQEIQRLDRGVTRCLDAVPADQRKLVTDHDAFAYLADRYDIEVVGAVIPATTTEAQASAGELAELRDLIESEGVRAVFPEASVTTDLAETIADETGASADHELYGDSLGPEGSAGATYLEMIRANADSLVRGFTGGELGCDA